MNKPIGVVLCGGESSRMGVDKGLINYHGIPQREYASKLLAPFCKSVMYSTGSSELDQENAFKDSEEFAGHGPISGLLSLHQHFPEDDLLLLACDYPLLRRSCLEKLFQPSHPKIKAFKNESGFPEPLISWYSAKALQEIEHYFQQGEDSLRRIFVKMEIQLLEPADKYCIMSADRPEDQLRVKEIIRSGKLNFA